MPVFDDPLSDHTVQLGDGRTLGYAEYGRPEGRPVFYFHGMPGSRLLGGQLVPAAEELNLRIVAPDRPGIGLSDFKPHRRLTDWPDDVVELADLLGVDRFAVVGTSGGGPYALACAWKIPERLRGVAVVSGVGPLDVPGAEEGMSPQMALARRLSRRAPWTIRPVMALLGTMSRRAPEAPMKQIEKSAPEPDRAVMANPDARELIRDGGAEAFRAGSRGVAHDMRLTGESWGFPLGEIPDKVDLWQGEEDTTVSLVTAKWLVAQIPNCRATFVPDAGHLWAVENMSVVLRALLEQPTP